VERLVPIPLGALDVVFELGGNLAPERLDHFQGSVAVSNRVDNDAQPSDIINVI
jgi:hypothetical protein